ncbi:hypothetical protein M8542_45780 [Amycolatopsis sp. OK19-0408]|uniref:Uncharacterized protein n=1 Tax=Amycolatopsis iheyensis TaxID=2945988 RepID=A0A9X2NNB5_9PSEU|nr:hypothetical protein [Amycolatopsis iheyensis]MCR6490145.1 hypothetical protein [Amycolatopsis iheyensis]
MANQHARHPATTHPATRRHSKRGTDEPARTDQDGIHGGRNERTSETTDPEPVARETYPQQQARLDAEAVDRWAVTVADWPPMTDEQIRALAVILNRIDARLAQQRPQRRQNG